MKYKEALKIIDKLSKGYMVSFDVVGGGVLKSDYFPDKHAGEELIKTKQEAWDLAGKFAKATTNEIVNVYVVNENFIPVDNNRLKKYK